MEIWSWSYVNSKLFLLDDYTLAWQAMKKSLTCQTSELDSNDEEMATLWLKRKRKPM